MASSKAKYMRRRRNAVIAAAALALILIIAIIIIIVGITKPSGSGSNLPTATPPATPLPTPGGDIGSYNPNSTTPPATIVTPSPTPAGNIMYVTGSTVNVRDKASSSGGVLTQVSKGTAVTVGKLEGDFYAVTLANGIEGYISKNFLSKQSTSEGPTPTPAATPGATPDTSNGKTMYVTGDGVNVRDAASSSGKVLTKLSKGDKVTAFETKNGWTYIEYASGKYGYFSPKYLTTTAPTTSATPTTPATPTPTPAAKTPISSWSEITNLPSLTWDTSADSTTLATREAYLSETYAQTTTNMGGQSGVNECYKIKKIDGTIYYIAINTENKANIYASLNDIPGTPVK